ncbi:hypothetical protein ABMA28_016782 [Loxostege sticticalis]|uniref:C2H2-type domain-containing protein n=1 Tax=Loxostege sticticalis TaxID=481309 RepID=A0ABD0T688_LOXSC
MTSVQEFNCILCKETFENKEDLQIHFRKHGDPKFNQSAKKSRPQSEAHASVAKKSEIEMVSCDVCSEMFPTISKAITHKHKMHPDHDAKYFCPWCGKLFTMKHLYNKHLQSNHVDSEQRDDSNFHCDACDVDFFVPTAMLYHNKFFHRQDTDLPSIGQSKKLKMCPQNTVIQIYYCSFCGDEYDNKVNLHKHINDDHSDENQSPEDVLRCPLCDAIFYHLDAYELHITFHTTDDLYSEKNAMFEQITEFSLETVAPIMEKVENVEPQDVETEMNAVGLDKFLELAMGESLDKDDKHKNKSKKHKKHKKSKKPAITLDEFLNMNKDVFGEGLDFEGAEEVPTQVVAKRFKQKKPTKAAIKSLETSKLETLKKQGIVVKMKSAQNPTMHKMNLGNKMLRKIPTSEIKPSSQIQSSDEVLSKLINQSNSQIKIVKKSSTQENVVGTELTDKFDKPTLDSTIFDKRGPSPENIEVECDVNMPSEYTSSENETKEEGTKKDNESINENDPKKISNRSNHCDAFQKEEKNQKEETNSGNEDDNGNNQVNSDEKKNVNTNNTNKNAFILQKNFDDNSNSDKPNRVTVSNSDNHQPIPVVDKGKNHVKDKTENYLENNPKSPPDLSTTNSLDALKHLSHLITVKSVTSKTSSAPASPVQKCVEQNEPKVVESQDDSDIDKDEEIETANNHKEIEERNEKSSQLEHLKKISNSITIKSLTRSPKHNTDDNSDDDEEMKCADEVASLAKNIDNKLPKIATSLQSVKPANEKEISKSSNIDLLKHLTNVTAKPVSAVKSKVQQMTNATISNMPNIVKKNAIKSSVKKEEINEEIEIFNIDDSDDEPDKDQQPLVKPSTQIPKANISENIPDKCVEKLKNIGQNVIVKSINQQTTPMKKNIVQQPKPEGMLSKMQHSMAEFSDDDEDDDQNTLIPTNCNVLKQKLTLENDHIKNTLKNLGKHITIKSGIPSPNPSIKSGNDQDFKEMFEQSGDSDSDSNTGVKISEVTEDNVMNEDDMAERDENVSVKSPEEKYSDDDEHDFHDDNDDELHDVEHQIKATTVKRPTTNITAQMLNLQNMNKNITIKSLSEKKSAPKEVEPVSKTKPIVNSELSIKPFKQTKPEGRDAADNIASKKLKNTAQVARSMSQNTAACSQQNTVNKEVTVKTIQTKTVIQEITTTVTKTIKTVNQTVKQELQSVQSTSQNNQMVFQKVQGMQSANQIKNFQGVTVRQAAPVAGTKIKTAATARSRPPVPQAAGAIRPSNQSVPVRPSNQMVPVRPSNQIVPVRPSNQIVPVRPSNQLVPVRPAMNTARMSRPRMAGPKKAMPSTSGNQQKPIKMSPQAMNALKRPMEESAGHFSCFKKPKESLIPVSEIPSFNSDQVGEAVVQYSSSHISKSNFTSATKTVKGGKAVTSTQMKSEMSASSQHLERLNSMSGLKVVKTSQMKQATKVEEKCESSELSASKRNTLEAIEKLQKQGLLIKKPRLDTSTDSDHSDEDNSYITEEPDDD